MLDLIGREREGEGGRPDKPLRTVGQASKSTLPSGEHYSLPVNMTFNQWLSLVHINSLVLSKCVSGRRWALVLLGTTSCAGGQRERGALGGRGGSLRGIMSRSSVLITDKTQGPAAAGSVPTAHRARPSGINVSTRPSPGTASLVHL